MDTEILKAQLQGFEKKGKDLRAQEAAFLKVQGLREQIEETRTC